MLFDLEAKGILNSSGLLAVGRMQWHQNVCNIAHKIKKHRIVEMFIVIEGNVCTLCQSVLYLPMTGNGVGSGARFAIKRGNTSVQLSLYIALATEVHLQIPLRTTAGYALRSVPFVTLI